MDENSENKRLIATQIRLGEPIYAIAVGSEYVYWCTTDYTIGTTFGTLHWDSEMLFTPGPKPLKVTKAHPDWRDMVLQCLEGV